MCHAIDRVFQLAMSTFTKKDNFKQKLEKLVQQSSLITGKDVGLDNYRSLALPPEEEESGERENLSYRAPVTYVKVVENPVVSMGIFIVREGENIPLHDHPSMHGIIKCLQGRLRITSFSRKETKLSSLPEKFSRGSFRQKIELGELFLAEPHIPVDLTPESGSCCLQPHSANIHQVESIGGPAAFLDILSPPYNIDPPHEAPDQEVRDCNYYQDVGDAGGGLRWLHLINPPASFYCDSDIYQGPGLTGVGPED